MITSQIKKMIAANQVSDSKMKSNLVKEINAPRKI